MSYNNREWDRGKDASAAWVDPKPPANSWYPQDSSRPNVRPREDDYYSQDKRRKFNNGGFDTPHNESSSDQQPSAAFPSKKRLQASEPSPHVIFLGLEHDFTESDLQAFLISHGCGIETVTIIRERATGTSKGFGFAQFPSTEHARAFVDPHFPFVQVPPPASHGATAKAAFYKALETGAPHNGRRIKIDYSQSASPHERRSARGNQNDGTRDIGNAPAPVLLLCNLDPLSGPQAIHQGMRNSAGPGKEGAKGMKRIILIKDKSTLASFCFGFVEFVDILSASTVLADIMSSTVHPNGFRISDKPVAAYFANSHSFQPVAAVMIRDEACVTSSLAMGGEEGTFVRYWDEGSTVAVLEFKVDTPAPTAGPVKEKKEKKKHKAETEAVIRPISLAPSTLPLSDKPVSLSLNKGAKLTLSTPKSLQSVGFSMEDNEDDAVAPTAPNKPHAVSKVGPMMGSRKIAGNINKWNQVQEKLSVSAPPPAPVPRAPKPPAPNPDAEAPSKTHNDVVPMDVELEFEFSDTHAKTCLLCARKFNSIEILRRHNKDSDLHKKNMQDPQLCEAARAKVATSRQEDGAAKISEADQPKYRDRASERRTLFNQPDAPMPPGGTSSTSHGWVDRKKQADASVPPRVPTPPAPLNPGQDESNVGNKLLKMMGWKEGTGLGHNAEGRVDPIETAIYAQGAGLGASKGKELAKYASGSYVSKAQDTARERFNT